MGDRKIVNGAYRLPIRSVFAPKCGYILLALPLGELSPKVTERELKPGFPSPSSLRLATSPQGRGKGYLRDTPIGTDALHFFRANAPLALPLGELSAKVTERVLQPASPLRPRCARPPLPKGEARGFAYAEEDCPYVRSSSRKPGLKNSPPSASTHMASAL